MSEKLNVAAVAVLGFTFENAYREIGQDLKVEGISEDKADVMSCSGCPAT